jgi:hypothetical protein
MFGQKITNTNEMLQCRILHCADLAAPSSAELNTALDLVCLDVHVFISIYMR